MSSSVAEREQVAVTAREPIPTVEAMEALDVGATVELRHGNSVERWTRDETGWVRFLQDGTATPETERTPLGTRFFSGALRSGLIRVVEQHQFMPLYIGEWLRVDVSTYQVLDAAADGVMVVARYRNGSWSETLTVDEAMLRAWMGEFRYERGIARPDYGLDRVVLWRTWLHGYRRAMAGAMAAAPPPVAPTPEPVIPPEFVTALQEYAAGAEDLDLDLILDRAGIGRRVALDVDVVVTGASDLQVDIPFAARELGMNTNEVTAISDSCRVTWQRRFTVQRTGAPGECVCGQVTVEDADLDDHLPGDRESFEITVLYCPNH